MKPQDNDRLMTKFGARADNNGVIFFDSHVELGQGTLDQIGRVAKMPFVEKVAVMPDAHLGIGATIGTVMATKGAIIPAAVGVDIGCGIDAFALDVKRDEIKDHQLPEILSKIQQTIPHGRTDNGGEWDKGKFITKFVNMKGIDDLVDIEHKYAEIARDAGGRHRYTYEHLGTLGTGNHFVELASDQYDNVWLMVHSGSRGPGAKLANFYIRRAKEFCNDWFVDLPDPNLAFLPSSCEEYGGYITAAFWAQNYAWYNRDLMAFHAMYSVGRVLGREVTYGQTARTPHNFLRNEKHFGKSMWITRKGASSASAGESVCIPGSMGTNSYIGTGTGNILSMGSSSHGAGRAMSRRKAIESISMEDHAKAMADVITSNLEDTVDESPAAYKDIDAVMASQTSLINVTHKLTPFLNMKG